PSQRRTCDRSSKSGRAITTGRVLIHRLDRVCPTRRRKLPHSRFSKLDIGCPRAWSWLGDRCWAGSITSTRWRQVRDDPIFAEDKSCSAVSWATRNERRYHRSGRSLTSTTRRWKQKPRRSGVCVVAGPNQVTRLLIAISRVVIVIVIALQFEAEEVASRE